MSKKDYTKYSENNINVENTDTTWDVTEETDGVHVRPVVDGEIIDTPVEEVITTEELENEEIITSTGETETDLEGESTIAPEADEEIHSGAIAPAVVEGCIRLNVREEADKDSDVVCVITKGTELTVDLDNSTEDFYKVYNVGGKSVEGYCMKNFISIK